jgi:hypothetical protein
MSTPENWCSPSELPPKDGDCQQISVSALCEQSWQPILITGMLRDMLIRHFADPIGIEHTDLRRYVWQDNERTGILIETVHKWKGELVEKRPAILVKRNAYRNQRVAIADLAGTNEKGEEQFTTLWVGSHTLFCIHGTGASTEILATEVQRELTQYAPAVRQYLRLHKFAVTEVGAISEVEEATENYVVPITLGWVYEESWRLAVESLPIRRIPLSILLDCEPYEVAARQAANNVYNVPPQFRTFSRSGIVRPGY